MPRACAPSISWPRSGTRSRHFGVPGPGAPDRLPLIGGGLLGKVREAEARELKAKQMNEVADAISWNEALGHDPAEEKRIRDEYEKLYYSGPTSLGH